MKIQYCKSETLNVIKKKYFKTTSKNASFKLRKEYKTVLKKRGRNARLGLQ